MRDSDLPRAPGRLPCPRLVARGAALARRCAAIALGTLLGLLLSSAASAAHAEADELLLGTRAGGFDGWHSATVLRETAEALTPAAVRAALPAFRPHAGAHANLGRSSHGVWVHVRLRLADDAPRTWWLDLGFPGIDRVAVYLYDGERLVQTVDVRNDVRFAQKPLPTRGQVVQLNVQPGGAYDLLLRIESTTAMLLPLVFAQPADYLRDESGPQLFRNMVLGVWGCLLCYALVQGLALRERMFFDYAGSLAGGIIFFLAFFGDGPQHLWGSNVWLIKNAWVPGILLLIGANALFVHDALQVERFHRGLAGALKGVALAAAITLVATLAGWIDLQHVAAIATALSPLPTLLGIAASLLGRRRGNPVASLVLIGWVVVLVGTLTMGGLQHALLPLGFWTEHALQSAMTVEIALWMFILASRVRQVQRSEEASRQENARLRELAFSDPLTGLLNRRGLHLALEKSLPAALPASAVAVYLLDLDEFKPVNDRYGHDAGDELLVEVGRRLKAQMKELDVVARLGGDEFVVVVHRVAGDAVAQATGRRLLSALNQPFAVAGISARVGVTIGYALAPEDTQSPTEALRCADEGLYAGKNGGRNQVMRGRVQLPALVPTQDSEVLVTGAQS